MNKDKNLLEEILQEGPKFHNKAGEGEVKRRFDKNESSLKAEFLERIISQESFNFGILTEVAKFIYDNISESSKTLETGAGISTLIFALRKTQHIAVTPNSSEVHAIKEYAKNKNINLKNITFVLEESEKFLPKCGVEDIDLVLIDGKHAFPSPIIDWFYTSSKLKKGGFIIIDDTELAPISILNDFMMEDRGWSLCDQFASHTAVFKKIRNSIHDVAWHMQPYVTNRCQLPLIAHESRLDKSPLGLWKKLVAPLTDFCRKRCRGVC